MGLEVYLFNINFNEAIIDKKVIAILESAGMTYLSEKSHFQTRKNYGNHYFEIRSDQGLLEAHFITSPGYQWINDFYLRFSILSPSSIIDVTFDFLKRLHEIKPVEVYDPEINNHIYRQLRKSGKVDDDFEGLPGEEAKAIDKLCIIPIDAADFKRNELEIVKRQIVMNNQQGEIIEGGHSTTDFIHKKGLFEKFLGWLRKEL